MTRRSPIRWARCSAAEVQEHPVRIVRGVVLGLHPKDAIPWYDATQERDPIDEALAIVIAYAMQEPDPSSEADAE